MKTIGNRDVATSSAMEVVRIKEYGKPYRHKIIDGPVKVHTVFYPTQGDEGKIRTMAVTVSDPFKNLFSPIIDMDRAIKKKEVLARTGDKDQANKVRSSLSPNTTYHCLVLDKADEVPVVKHAEYPFSAYKQFTDLENSPAIINDRGDKDESKLRYGLMFMLWFEIMRLEKGTSKDIRFNTEYKVNVMERLLGEWENQVPSHWLNPQNWQEIDEAKKQIVIHTPTKVYPINVVELEMFTEEEFQAIVNYPHSLAELVVPMTDDEALEKLQSYPIMLDARDQSGNFYLPHWETLREALEGHHDDLPFMLSGTQRKLAPHEEEEELPDELPESLPEKSEVVEAEVVEEESEESKEEPAKKRGRPAKALFADDAKDSGEESKATKKKDVFASLF